MSLFFLRRSAWEVQSGKSIEERKGKLLQSDVLELGDIEIRMPEQRHVYSCIHISSYVYLFFIVVLRFFGGSILYPPLGKAPTATFSLKTIRIVVHLHLW